MLLLCHTTADTQHYTLETGKSTGKTSRSGDNLITAVVANRWTAPE